MTSEQPPRDALRPLRPLPSIDIPLLREERSAVRSRRLIRIAIAGAALVMVGGSAAFAAQHYMRASEPATEEPSTLATATEEPTHEDAVTIPEPPPPVALPSLEEPGEEAPGTSPEPAAEGSAAAAVPAPRPAEPEPTLPETKPSTRTEHSFGKALSFRDALEKNGLSREESNTLIEVLDAAMDFRRSQPDDHFWVERDAQGKLLRFEYHSGLTLRYEAKRDAQGKLKARQIPVPVRVVRVSKGGVVTGSLGDSLEGLGLGRSLAGVFTEVFEGRINFSTETRAGDTFRILFEEEYVEDKLLRTGNVQALEYKGEKAGTHRAFWYEPKGEDGDFYDESGRALHGGWLRTPLRYDHISSGFGMRKHPVLKRKLLHNGIDYAAGSGTPVRAAATGSITFAGPKGPNGNLLVIAHAQSYETCYAHLLRFASGIKQGVKVKQRQVVAYVGSTGRSTGPHLHFSLKKSGRFVDPALSLNGPGLPMPAKDLPDYKRKVRDLSSALARVPIQQPAPVSTPSTPPSAPVDMGEEEL